jgi:hypothetical protein
VRFIVRFTLRPALRLAARLVARAGLRPLAAFLARAGLRAPAAFLARAGLPRPDFLRAVAMRPLAMRRAVPGRRVAAPAREVALFYTAARLGQDAASPRRQPRAAGARSRRPSCRKAAAPSAGPRGCCVDAGARIFPLTPEGALGTSHACRQAGPRGGWAPPADPVIRDTRSRHAARSAGLLLWNLFRVRAPARLGRPDTRAGLDIWVCPDASAEGDNHRTPGRTRTETNRAKKAVGRFDAPQPFCIFGGAFAAGRPEPTPTPGQERT